MGNLYFMSDRGGAQNLWSMTVGRKPRQVTKFNEGRVLLAFDRLYDGKTIVFERDFPEIWQLDTKTGEAYPIPITLVGSANTIDRDFPSQLDTGFNDMAVSADARRKWL